jgi:hypothetical protein
VSESSNKTRFDCDRARIHCDSSACLTIGFAVGLSEREMSRRPATAPQTRLLQVGCNLYEAAPKTLVGSRVEPI